MSDRTLLKSSSIIYSIIFLLRMNASGNREFYSGRVGDEGVGEALVFIDRDLLQGLSRSEEISMDGTFTVVPRIFTQLATVQFVAYDRVSCLNCKMSL